MLDLEKSLETIINNDYKGKVIPLIYDDTSSSSVDYNDYKSGLDKLLDKLFSGTDGSCSAHIIVPAESKSMGSAYALYRLREYFVTRKDARDSDIAIILDQDDELKRDAIRNIVKRMPENGIVVSPFRIEDNDGIDITDDGGRIHNILARILSFECLTKLLLDSRIKEEPKYQKLFFPFSLSELKDLFIGIGKNALQCFEQLKYNLLGLFKLRYGYADLSSICWTKSYSFKALEQYHNALTEFIGPGKGKIKTFYSQLNAYEDFIDFYVLLLKDVPISGNLSVSHIYKKHKNSITATPNIDDFQLKRTNSLLTLIDLSYSTKRKEAKFRKNYKLMLHRFVASKVCQISCILNNYIKNYKEEGKKEFAAFAAKVHNRYFVNKLTRLALGKNRGTRQDKKLFKQQFSRSKNTKSNFIDLFSVYKSIPQYKCKLDVSSARFILLCSAEQEKILRKIKENKEEGKQWNEISSHRRTQGDIIFILLVVFFVITIDILVPDFRLFSPFLLKDIQITASAIGFLGAIITILSREYARIKTAIEEDVSTLKLYYSEFSDFIRHLEANIKILIEIRKQATWTKIDVQSIHSENLKWPENSILLSDEMAKLIPKNKVDDFTRLKINIRNINNSSKWLTELINQNKLTVSELDWEISRYFGYLINLYYLREHDFKFASHDELDNYIDENFIKFRLTELFMSYPANDRMKRVEYYMESYQNDRRMKRAILKK
ncbi:MAG: hypothetical protein UIC45_07620 [Paludibacteraceae bacterium]|nr:hypothetical protein [Paludibacteraceae bacterium]